MYVPATRSDLAEIGNGLKLPNLRSVIFCTEDSVSQADLPLALKNLQTLMPRLDDAPIHRFIRPRNQEVLKALLAMPHINRLDGFVLPKVDLTNLPQYLKILEYFEQFEIMPILETKAVFDLSQMRRLCDFLAKSPLASRIAVLRVGSMDLMSLLSLRRDVTQVIYNSPIGHAIDQLLAIFRPAQFELSAPGFEGLDQPQTLIKELAMDVNRGLFSKTCVHPCQLELIHDAYKAQPEELEMAKAIVNPQSPAVFRFGGRMCEKAVHTNWAVTVLERARNFGSWPNTPMAFYPAGLESEFKPQA
jgi:citrate lyase beta subunit